jgi:hypothetical protein
VERLEDRWAPTINATGANLVAAEHLSQTFQVATFTDTSPAPVSDYSATIDWGNGTTSAGVITLSGNTYQVSGTVTYAEEVAFATPEQITVTINKNDGQTAMANSTASVADADIFTVGDLSLTATGLTSFNLSAAFSDSYPASDSSDYTATIDWGDGTTAAGNLAANSGNFTVTGTHTYAGTGNFNVSVTLADDSPSVQSATSTGTASVGTGNLTVAGGTIVPTEGQLFAGTAATFFTSGNGSFTASIDWGDGATSAGTVSGSNGSFSVKGTHTYAEEGSYTTTIQVSETGGPSGSATGTARVGDAPLQVLGTAHKIRAAGVAVNNLLVATFSDNGGGEPVGNYTATINFGDGTTGSGTISSPNGFPAGTFAITASHTYAGQGTYTITTTVQDEAGSMASSTSKVAVGWIAGVYLDLLHRPIDPTGLAGWNALFNRGVSRQQIVTDIEGSVEYRMDEVQAAYTQFLHRNADTFGLNAFVNALGSGLTLAQVEALILSSPEFFQRAGGTNSGFITALYHDLLNRSPESGGLTAFLSAMNAGATQEEVAAAFLSSDEYHQDIINIIYLQYLRRNAESFGLNAFTQLMHNGLTQEALIAIILSSSEYVGLTA